MNCSPRCLRWAVLPVAAALWLSAAAQAPVVLKDRDITENALIDALTPAPADSGTGAPGLTFRSIRVIRDNPPGTPTVDQVARPARAPQASLLITFVTNSADLTPDARASLDVLAKALLAPQLAGFRFSIEGHADPRGGAELNLRLSQARAESVAAYLVAQHGIERGRLQPAGKGDRELMNTTRIDAPENRRVTITTLQ